MWHFSPNRKKNKTHRFEGFRPNKPPQQNTPHIPKNNRVQCPSQRGNRSVGSRRRLDLWNAGRGARGTLVGPGMEAIMDPPPRYGSSVAWLGDRWGGGKDRFGGNPKPRNAKVVPLQREPFLKGSFGKFSAFNHQFSGDMLVSSEGLHVRKDGDYSIDSIWM